MFTICDGKGFKMKFENGNTVSVQWGPMNYCEPEIGNDFNAHKGVEFWKSKKAEVAAWDEDRNWHQFDFDTVRGWMSTDEVLEFMNFVANNKLNTEE